MATATKAIGQSYNSFSGIDIKAVFNNVAIGELQAISYSITREKAPLYTMGSADPRAFSRGKRGIAGTLIFLMFDRHALLGSLSGSKFQSDVDDIDPKAQNATTLAARTVANQETNQGASDQALANPWYADQIPPFDITLAAANEYGALANMAIYGVEILNEGYGVSIDDIVSEQQMTYVARGITPWQAGTLNTGVTVA